ncbi:uncharacterized protein LOC130053245 [Ostrea edulis]|uniref:uncharacterized protein LOC130053245 n=1 Tax=Ostrea edulis TaxID=37623 RepID=UPI0024AEE10B|nr:uncharacterized protein LOC130053245 [Ostrea edulis]
MDRHTKFFGYTCNSSTSQRIYKTSSQQQKMPFINRAYLIITCNSSYQWKPKINPTNRPPLLTLTVLYSKRKKPGLFLYYINLRHATFCTLLDFFYTSEQIPQCVKKEGHNKYDKTIAVVINTDEAET